MAKTPKTPKTEDATAAGTPAKPSKAKLKRQYILDGDDHAGMTFTEVATGRSISVRVDELPEHIQRQAAAFGLNVVLGNEFNTDTSGDAFGALSDRLSGLHSGTWASRERGVSETSLIVEAIVRAKESAGQKADREAIVAKCADKAYVATAKKVAAVKLAMAQIQAERLESRAAESDLSDL